jgi:hypothetical protein
MHTVTADGRLWVGRGGGTNRGIDLETDLPKLGFE